MADWPVHGKIDGPIVMIGFGSIGKGTLPLIERHFSFDQSRFVVIDPDDSDRAILDQHGVRFIQEAVTRDNYRDLLTPLLTAGGGQGFCVNLSVDTSSLDIMRLCRELGALYIDTVVEPWPGFYFDKAAGPEARTNYALRETVRAEKAKNPGGTDRRLLLRRQSRHGVVVRQAGAGRPRPRRRPADFAEPDDARGLGAARARPRRQGHPHRRARHPARQKPEADGRLRQHLVGRGLPVGRHAAGRARLGHPREVDAGERPHRTTTGSQGRDLPAPARRQHPRPLVVPDAGRRNTASSSPTTSRSRSPTTSRSARATRWSTGRPATTPITRPNDAVLSLHELFGRAGSRPGRAPHPRRARDRRRHRRARRPPLRPRQERLLVRLAALDRRDPRPRPLPERHRPAGDLGRARRHGLGAGESATPASSRPTRWTTAAASRCSCPISARSTASTPTGRRSPNRPGLFPEDIDESDPWQFRNVLVR